MHQATSEDIAKQRRAQWGMVATLGMFILAMISASYGLVYPRVLNDLRTEWSKDVSYSRSAITDNVAREFAAIRDQLAEIKQTAKETASRLDSKLDRLAERVK